MSRRIDHKIWRCLPQLKLMITVEVVDAYLFLPPVDLNGRLYMNVVIMNIKRKPKVAATAIFRMLCSWLSGRRLAAPT